MKEVTPLLLMVAALMVTLIWVAEMKLAHHTEQSALDRQNALAIAKIERGECDPFYEAPR